MVSFVTAINLFSLHCSLETGLGSGSASASDSVDPETAWLLGFPDSMEYSGNCGNFLCIRSSGHKEVVNLLFHASFSREPSWAQLVAPL